MPINLTVDKDKRVLRIKVTGTITFEQEQENFAKMLETLDADPGYAILYDDRERENVADTDYVRAMAEVFSLHAERVGAARISVLVSRTVSYGLARMFGLLTEDTASKFRVFNEHEEAEAEAWLTGPGEDDGA